jgi:zinc protease
MATGLLAGVAVLLLGGQATHAIPPVSAPPVEAVTLDNGLRVLVSVDRRAPLVTVAVMYSVGAKNEAAGTTGLAHYAEHMNFRALRGFPGSETTECITRIGGRWTGYTWIDQTYYAETVHKGALPRMLDLEAARMREALYEPTEFEKERSSVMAELRSYDDPRSVLYDSVLAAAFEIHPYRNNTIGWPSDVEGVTRDEAWRFYRRFYQPGNAVLVIAGDVDPPRAIALARERLGRIAPDGEPAAVRTVEPPQSGQRRVTVRRPGPRAHLMAAFRAPALTDPDFPAMAIADALVSGGRGFRPLRDYAEHPEAPLAQALVASRLATRAATAWQVSLHPYVFTVEAAVPRADGLEAAERALFRVLEDAGRRPITDADLAAARRQVLTSYALDLDDLPTRAHQLALFELAGGHRHLLALPERLLAVSAADVRRFVRERLTPDRATIGWFVPADEPSPVAADAAVPAPPPAGPATAGAAAPPLAGPARPLPAAQDFVLPSGMRVRTSPLSGPLAVVRARVDLGPWTDRAAAAVLVELLARASAVADPAVQVVRPDDEGAPAPRGVDLEVAVLADDVPAAVSALGARLSAAAGADASALAAARAAAASRARDRDGATAGAALRVLLDRLYGAGGGPGWATAAEVEAVSDDTLARFVRGRLAPPRFELAVAGAVPPDLRELVTRAFGPRAGAARPSAPDPPPAFRLTAPRAWTDARHPFPAASQDTVMVAWPAPRGRVWDGAAVAALLYLVGETGYAGRLGHALVDPGLVYSVYATREDDGIGGLLRVQTAAAPGDSAEVVKRIRVSLEAVAAGGVSSADLEEAKAYLRGKRARRLQGTASAARALLDAAAEPAEADVERLTLAQLADTARRLFASGGPVAVVAGAAR